MLRGSINKLLVEKTDSTLIQLVRYGFVGGLAFLVDFGLLFALTEYLGLHYLLSAALAFLGGLGTNFALSVLWVFSSHTVKSRTAEFAIFAAIGVAGLGLNELIMWLTTDVFGRHYLVSKIISTIIVFAWNFLVRKFMLYR